MYYVAVIYVGDDIVLVCEFVRSVDVNFTPYEMLVCFFSQFIEVNISMFWLVFEFSYNLLL